eukprot:scaffold53361_cov18-Tisochrysis_lutea.AAC.1
MPFWPAQPIRSVHSYLRVNFEWDKEGECAPANQNKAECMKERIGVWQVYDNVYERFHSSKAIDETRATAAAWPDASFLCVFQIVVLMPRYIQGKEAAGHGYSMYYADAIASSRPGFGAQ